MYNNMMGMYECLPLSSKGIITYDEHTDDFTLFETLREFIATLLAVNAVHTNFYNYIDECDESYTNYIVHNF